LESHISDSSDDFNSVTSGDVTSGTFDDLTSGHIGDVMAEMEDEPDLENEEAAGNGDGDGDGEEAKTVVGRLRALQSVTIFVQVTIFFNLRKYLLGNGE
jgi:hypothetical protein